jgi:hypothetical protein
MTSCGHRFCAGCIRGCRDCPVCGADISSLQPDAQTQGACVRLLAGLPFAAA